VSEEVPLAGGRVTTVVRVGDTVRRATGPWTPTVHAYLRHLEAEGFRGAPRLLGLDEQGREILTWVEGEVASSSSWELGRANPLPAGAHGEDSLAAAGALIRELHDAARSFGPVEPVWREYPHPLGPGEIVCHGDLGPHNTVYRDGLPVAFIDWDGARPNLPELELGLAACWFVPLADEAYCAELGFAETPDVARRLRVFCDAYGLQRADVLPAVQQAMQRHAERLRYWPGITAAEAAAILRFVVRDLEWLDANRSRLERALA